MSETATVWETHTLHFSDGDAQIALTVEGDIEVNFRVNGEVVFSLDAVNFKDLVARFDSMNKDA